MPVRLEKMGECILRLRKERGYSLEELAGLYSHLRMNKKD